MTTVTLQKMTQKMFEDMPREIKIYILAGGEVETKIVKTIEKGYQFNIMSKDPFTISENEDRIIVTIKKERNGEEFLQQRILNLAK